MSPSFRSRVALLPLLAAVGVATAGMASAASLTEGFDAVGQPVPLGWTAINNSAPVGTTGWFEGNTTDFAPQAGASYIAANFNNTAVTGTNNTISNWLISPTLTFNNGDVISFWTRTVDLPVFADRLELRFSNVGGTNVGTLPDDVGTFTRLLVSVNPDLTATGFPTVWTQFTSTISFLSGPTSGAIAFRYFVTSGGYSGLNSDYIGIDSLTITPVPEPATYGLMGLGIAGVVLAARRRKLA